jgi:phospholipid/cholesterol/gamma-HCH transport system substrate-binding protein
MKELRRNLMVGVFVLAGLLALGTLIVLFGQAPEWLSGARTYPIYVFFKSAGGIKTGTQVTVYGKEIGRVRSVDFRDPQNLTIGVRVIADIGKQYQLPDGSTAITYEAGLLSGSRPPVEIIPGPPTAQALAPGASIGGKTISAAQAIFPESIVNTFELTATRIGEAAEKLAPVLDDLHGMLEPRMPEQVDRPLGPPGNLSSAAARFDTGLKNLNVIIGDPQTQSQVKQGIANFYDVSANIKDASVDIKAASADARQVATDAKALVVQAQGSLTKLDDNVDHVARSANTSMENISSFFVSLRQISDSVNAGQGSLGKLVKDNQFYDALVFTVRKLGEAAERFKEVADEWIKGRIKVTF